jgi:hypothetical protein
MPADAKNAGFDAMKSKLGAIFLGILIFVLGAIAGAVGCYLIRVQANAKASAPKTIPRVEDVVEGMATVLNLDAQQKEAVKVIIGESRTSYRELWQQFRPQYEAIVQDSDNRIRALLREEQKPLFEAYLKKIKSKTSTASKPAATK